MLGAFRTSAMNSRKWRYLAARRGAQRHRANGALQDVSQPLEGDVAPRTPELRRKEWYLEEAERLSHTGSWTLDLGSGSLGFWSDETFRIFGLPPRSEVPGKDYLERFVHPKDLPYALAARQSACDSGAPLMEFATPDRSSRWRRSVHTYCRSTVLRRARSAGCVHRLRHGCHGAASIGAGAEAEP